MQHREHNMDYGYNMDMSRAVVVVLLEDCRGYELAPNKFSMILTKRVLGAQWAFTCHHSNRTFIIFSLIQNC